MRKQLRESGTSTVWIISVYLSQPFLNRRFVNISSLPKKWRRSSFRHSGVGSLRYPTYKSGMIKYRGRRIHQRSRNRGGYMWKNKTSTYVAFWMPISNRRKGHLINLTPEQLDE